MGDGALLVAAMGSSADEGHLAGELEVVDTALEVVMEGLTRLDVTATCLGEKVLSQARATIRSTR